MFWCPPLFSIDTDDFRQHRMAGCTQIYCCGNRQPENSTRLCGWLIQRADFYSIIVVLTTWLGWPFSGFPLLTIPNFAVLKTNCRRTLPYSQQWAGSFVGSGENEQAWHCAAAGFRAVSENERHPWQRRVAAHVIPNAIISCHHYSWKWFVTVKWANSLPFNDDGSVCGSLRLMFDSNRRDLRTPPTNEPPAQL